MTDGFSIAAPQPGQYQVLVTKGPALAVLSLTVQGGHAEWWSREHSGDRGREPDDCRRRIRGAGR